MTNTLTERKAYEEPVEAPSFWPTAMMDELKVAQAIRRLIDPAAGDLDIYSANSVMEYGIRLQALSGSGAELMARMRMALEEKRGEAIAAAMVSEEVRFEKMSATIQNKYVDGKIAVYHAAYTYAEFLNKRISYAMDYVRSLLSYIKTDMQNNNNGFSNTRT